MGKVWVVMVFGAVAALLFTDPGAAVTAMVTGSHAAVKLALQLVALYGFWLGFFGIIEKIGLADALGRALHPLVRRLFPGLSKTGEKYVTMNMAANMLGLGNAATPMAIKAIKEMEQAGQTRASRNMKMLTVLSCTSLQLLPTTVIGLRATHGAVNPVDFLLPATVATVVSTVLGVVLCKLLGRLGARKEAKIKAPAPLPLGIGGKL